MHALGALLASSLVDVFEPLAQASHGNNILHHYFAHIEQI